jgi:imidazolonepropionase
MNGVSATIFVGAAEVVSLGGPAGARRGTAMNDIGVLTDTAVVMQGDRITAVGPERELRRAHADAAVVDCAGGVLTPGLVDSHTHVVFGAGRFAEHELRATGVPYMEIARQGGGIHASVRDLRSRTVDELVALALPRLKAMAASGVTTVEIKSGYGLALDDEITMLRAIRRLAVESPLRIVPTFMGAHEIPVEYRDVPHGRDAYMSELCDVMLPTVAQQGLARFADVFCEPGVFTIDEARRYLERARLNGLGLKLHADELEGSGAAELGVSLGAVSVDHLAAISAAGVDALGAAPTVATLLPGTMLFLGRERQAPARALIEAGAAVALATDANPGTSPILNLGIILTLGVSVLRLRVAEVFTATTVNGAAALGLADRVGRIAVGCSADLALWDVGDHREIPYWFGERMCRASWSRGKPCHP